MLLKMSNCPRKELSILYRAVLFKPFVFTPESPDNGLNHSMCLCYIVIQEPDLTHLCVRLMSAFFSFWLLYSQTVSLDKFNGQVHFKRVFFFTVNEFFSLQSPVF